MRTQIPVPSKGDAMRASWGAAVASRVNELCAMAPANMLARDGFGGMGAQPLPANLRDHPGGGVGQLMPFDIRATIETRQNEGVTEKRLVIKCAQGKVIWCGPELAASNDQTPGVQIDVAPWKTIYTGEWTEEFEPATYVVFLNYRLTVSPEWDAELSPLAFAEAGTNIFFKVSAEEVVTENSPPEDPPYGDVGFYYAYPPAQILIAWLRLGIVRVSSSGTVSTEQRFHGDLVLSDLLTISAEGGGGGGDGDEDSARHGCWSIGRTVEDGEGGEIITSTFLKNCYYNVGGISKVTGDKTVPANATGFLCAVFSGGGVSVLVYAGVSALNAAQADETKYIVPLYQMNAGKVVLDMRNAPQIQVFEGSL